MSSQQLKYGEKTLSLRVPDANLQGVLLGKFPSEPEPEEEAACICRSLQAPIGTPPLHELARGKQRVVIMVSDITRPAPSYKFLPPILDELEQAGVAAENVTVIFGLGTHRPHTDAEKEALLGKEVYRRIRCMDSTEEGFRHLATSSRGTPYLVANPVCDADFIICTGNIEFHWFVGYSGGIKALLPGACAPQTINANHAMLTDPQARAGNMQGNPVRADMEELSQYLRADFIVNVVLDDHKRILACFSGHHVQAHREGCAYLDSIYKKRIDKQADIVIVGGGGFPKDLNLYQAQKALDNAAYAVREGGTLMLVAQCREGWGSKAFRAWLEGAPSREDVLSRIQASFAIGGHKAAAFAKTTLRSRVILVSDTISPEEAALLWSESCPPENTQARLDALLEEYGPGCSVLFIPQGGSILPDFQA